MEDTIAAFATPPVRETGDGAVGVIRVSGPLAFAIAEKIYRGKKPFCKIKPYTIGYGFIYDAAYPHEDGMAAGEPVTGGIVDEVLILKMRAPRSYTCEDVVEIHCHAGAGVQRRILRLILREGARAAGPGEFTKRAFLNGRIDLAQAEAVMDLIRTKSEAGASVAIRQLEGALSARLASVRDDIIGIVASVEAFLDFPEHEVEEQAISDIDAALENAGRNMQRLADSFGYGRAAREGVAAVISGRPNVGKSTLLNLFAGKERAIVTDTPGTTRDVIDEYINLGGLTVRFLDTAGIRETCDAVEKIGVDRAIAAVEKADIVLVLFAADEGFAGGDAGLMEIAKNKKRVFIINKTDLATPEAVSGLREAILTRAAGENNTPGGDYEIICASFINVGGVAEIENAVLRLAAGGAMPGYGDAVVSNERHYGAIMRALESVGNARGTLRAGLPLEMPVIDMREALSAIGEITGETYAEDIIDRIFSEFCVGK